MSRRQAPGERARGRKAVIAAALPLGLLAAVIGQLTVVNRLSLPGGDAPDLVLLLVIAVAVRAAPLTAALTGFAGGLALDAAPPQTHYTGEYALVFCLAAYGAARVAAQALDDGSGGRPAGAALTVMVAAAAAGEAGKAAIGLLLSDPNVTAAAIRSVLPGAVGYDLLLSPVVLGLVALAAGRPGASTSVPRPEFAAAGRLAAGFRLASAGAAPGLQLAGSGPVHRDRSPGRRVPKLRLAGSGPVHRDPSWARREAKPRLAGRGPVHRDRSPGRRVPKLRLAGSGPVHRDPSWARRQPRPRLSRARAQSFSRTNRGASPTALPLLAGGRAAKLHFSSYRRSAAGRSGSLGSGTPYAPASRAPRSLSRGWLHRYQAAAPAPAQRKRPGKGWLRRAPSPRPARRVSSPSRGWLRSPRGWLRSSRRPLAQPAYTSRPYRSSRRRYRRRLLALVGGRR